MKRHMSCFCDAIRNGSLEFRAERQHGAKHLTEWCEVVVGDPLAEAHQRRVEHRLGIERLDNIFGLNLRLVIVQAYDDSGKALLAEGDENSSTDDGLHAIRDAIG